MAVKSTKVQVGQNPTRVSVPDRDFSSGSEIIIRPSATIAIGGPDVTMQNGFSVTANSEFAMSLRDTDVLYAVTETGNATVSVLQAGV